MNNSMFTLLKSALWGEQRYPAVFPEDTDWTAIYQELRYQAVTNIPLDILCRVDPTHKTTYIQGSLSKLKHYYNILKEQQRLCELLNVNQIPCAIVKGTSAAQYYPTPSYRNMGDVDIIVSPKDFRRAFDLMQANGFTSEEEEDMRHSHFKRNGVIFELHRYFTLLNNGSLASMLDNRIFEALHHTRLASLDGFTFLTLPDVENGLIFLEHICQHLETGIGLRQIIDWMMFVDKTLDDDAWNTQYKSIVKALGFETLAITVTRMCQLYLGLREDITWCKNADIFLCEDLLNALMESGNFGHKQGVHTTQSINSLMALKNISGFFARLQYCGTINWKILKKNSWLKPFAWIYQLCRYIKKGFSHEKPIRHLFQNIKKSRKKDNLLERLEVSRLSQGCETPFGMRF